MPGRIRRSFVSAGSRRRRERSNVDQHSSSFRVGTGPRDASFCDSRMPTNGRSESGQAGLCHSSVEPDAFASLTNRDGQVILPGFGIPFALEGHQFPIPILPVDTPREYKVAMSLNTAAAISDVFLSREILRDSDWDGRFLESLSAGTERWANGEMNGHFAEYLDVAIIITDDIAHLYFDDASWAETAVSEGHPDGVCERYGAFAFETDLCESIVIGKRVEELNLLESCAGYEAARVLTRALSEFHAFTPERCEEMIERYYEDSYYSAEEQENEWSDRASGSEEDEDEYVSMKEFRKAVPSELYEGPETIEAVVLAKDKARDEKTIRLLDDIIDLHYLTTAAEEEALDMNGYRLLGHSCYGHEDNVPPVVIFYELQDIEERVFDDYHNSMTQGEHSYLCFLHCFNMNEKNSIHRGASALSWALKLLVLADQVLQGMNWDESRDHRFSDVVRTREQKVADSRQRSAEGRNRPPITENSQ